MYDNRPVICRLFGAVDDLRCPYGCEPKAGLMSSRDGHATTAAVQALDRPARRR